MYALSYDETKYRGVRIVSTQRGLDYPGQAIERNDLEKEASHVIYQILIEEELQDGEASVEYIEVPGRFLDAILHVLLVPGISLQYGLPVMRLRILGITPIGPSLDERLRLHYRS